MKQSTNICLWFLGICLSTHLHFISGQAVPASKPSDSNSSVIIISTNSTNQTSMNQTDHHHHYVVRLYFTLDEGSIISYIRDDIFHNNFEHNITTEDLVELFNLRALSLDESFEKFRALNISENTLSVASFKSLLEFINMTFTDFYEKLKTGANLTGIPLLEALQILNIDSSNFSHAVTYGQQENVYEVLSTGIYTRENFQKAASKLGTDLDTFFKHMKNIIVDQMVMNSLSYYGKKIQVLFPNASKKCYDDVWSTFNISMFDVYSVPNIRNIIDDLTKRLHANTSLGLATSPHEITIHKKIYKRLETYLGLININAAEVVNYENSYDSLTFTRGSNEKIATLWSNDSIVSTVDISEEIMSKNDQNCTYLTINNTQVIENEAKILNDSQSTIIVEIENGTLFNVGNPLICQGKLVGLADMRHEETNLIIFDAFHHASEKISNSSPDARNITPLVFSYLIFLFTLRLIQ